MVKFLRETSRGDKIPWIISIRIEYENYNYSA